MDDQRKETILFVDDEESILNVVTEFFRRRGYHILTARNGAEAMKIIDNEKVDCCFTDINMPVMNGLDLAENIRLHDNTMPVIVMTGYPSLENTIQTIKNGVVDFLIKPVNLKQMELCMQRVLRQRGLFIENVLLKEEVQSKERLEKLEVDLANMNDEIMKMKVHWQNEKDLIQTIRKIKEEQEQLGIEEQQAEREGNLARVAEIRYGRASDLETRLQEANKKLFLLQKKCPK